MPAEPESERRMLVEKHRALQALVRCERDIDKLRMYVRELDLVSAELQKTADTLDQRKNSKVLPFRAEEARPLCLIQGRQIPKTLAATP